VKRPKYNVSAKASQACLKKYSITPKMQRALRKAGYRQRLINKMTFEEASDAIEAAIKAWDHAYCYDDGCYYGDTWGDIY